MNKKTNNWTMTIIDGMPDAKNLAALATGDIDGDGNVEIVTGGEGGLLWYRPATSEQGKICNSNIPVGIALEDVDGDGILEVVTGEDDLHVLSYFKPGKNLNDVWTKYVIDPDYPGSAHDIIFADIDGDGKKELVANAVYCETPAVYAFKPGTDVKKPWQRYTIGIGDFAEGLCAGDVDNDGRMEIINGPWIYHSPEGDMFSGFWGKKLYANTFRDMCRTALIDITGNGSLDIVIIDSEYDDCKISWYENRYEIDSKKPWLEHSVEEDILVYPHSIDVWKDERNGTVNIFTAEMMQGGFGGRRKFDAMLFIYSSSDNGKTWEKKVVDKGNGTHQAFLYDIDNDGELEIIGKEWGKHNKTSKVQIWKQERDRAFIDNFKYSLMDISKPHMATEIITADIDGDGMVDVASGAWWYRNPEWNRYDIPNVDQIVNSYDVDGDGKDELIAVKKTEKGPEFYWLKPVNPQNGDWKINFIGIGSGDMPSSTAIAPFMKNGAPALAVAYQNSVKERIYPEIFTMPENKGAGEWASGKLSNIFYDETFTVYDIDGDGYPDIIAGGKWLKNDGTGRFIPYSLCSGIDITNTAVMDMNGNGLPDIIMSEKGEISDILNKRHSRLIWLENPGTPEQFPWKMHVIDKVRYGHSLNVYDIDGDGKNEIILGEYDEYTGSRTRCKLLVYKAADDKGAKWKRYTLDSRFSHYNGAKVFEPNPETIAILSHSWCEYVYLHMWTKRK